ncbi:MAG: hypothetical protein NDJ18_04140 [candidate division Zixibacteria bacterium]|nr:hypothetical protein [candidate division Zixibacteria bacterium]
MSKRITLTETDDYAVGRSAPHGVTDLHSLSAVELARIAVKHRRPVLLLTLAMVILTTAIVLIIPNKYMSQASLLPSGAHDKMADLKRLAGFGSLSAADENSSELFPEILRSRSIQDSVLATPFSFSHDARRCTLRLSEYFDQDNPDKLRSALNEITYIVLDKKTGVIDISVETKYPELSKQVLTSYLTELESFNLLTRRSAARENAAYLGRQIELTRQEMAKAEDELESYQASNRNWLEGSSPDLLKTIARLQREVEIQNKKYLYLTQEYEIAKLDAQKDVPIVRVLDSPSLPVEKSSPKRALIILTMGMLAALLSSFGVVLRELAKGAAEIVGSLRDSAGMPAGTDRMGEMTELLHRTDKSPVTEELKV